MAFEKSVGMTRVICTITTLSPVAIYRFSGETFSNGGYLYDGRLLNLPSVSIARDSNEFGILVFSASSIELNNADGYFDSISTTFIGATCQFAISDDDVTFHTIFTGYVESVSLNEITVTFSITDLRKRLLANNLLNVSLADANDAVTVIENILIDNYNITAGSSYFDVSAMTAAKAVAPLIYRTAPENDTVTTAIEACVDSTMGFFFITPDGKYSYKMIDTDSTAVTTINHYEILNEHNIEYNTDEIIAKMVFSCVSGDITTNTYPVQNDSGTSHATSTYYDLNDDTHVFISTGRFDSPYDSSVGSIIISTDINRTFTVCPLVTGAYSTATSPYMSLSAVTAGSTGDIYVLADTSNNLLTHMYKSTDMCSSFSALTSTGFTVFSATRVNRCLARCLNDSIIVNLGYKNIRKLTYGASTFTDISISTADSVIYSINEITAADLTNGAPTFGAPTASAVLLFTGLKDAGIGGPWPILYKSTDYGSSWSVISAISGLNPGYVYAPTILTNNVWLLWHYNTTSAIVTLRMTTNGGGSFSTILTGAAGEWITQILPTDIGTFVVSHIIAGAVYTSKLYKLNPDSVTHLPTATVETVWTSVGTAASYMKNAKYVHTENTLIGYSAASDIVYSFFFNDTLIYDNQASTLSTLYAIDRFEVHDTLIYYGLNTMASDKYSYFNSLHGKLSITVPMKYYTVNVGDNVDVEIWRETSSMLGTEKCEVVGKSYDLNNSLITFELRII